MKVKCIEPWGLLAKGEVYEVKAEGSSAYTITLPDGRNGYFGKERFEIVPERNVAEVALWNVVNQTACSTVIVAYVAPNGTVVVEGYGSFDSTMSLLQEARNRFAGEPPTLRAFDSSAPETFASDDLCADSEIPC